jgi:hypothetical protein
MIFTLIWYIARCLGINFSIFSALGLDFLNLFFMSLLFGAIHLTKQIANQEGSNVRN